MTNNRQTGIIIAGFGGQGIVLAGNTIARACLIEGRNVTQIVSYGAEMRGGTANTTIVVSDRKIASPVLECADAAIILNQPSLDRFESAIAEGGVVIVNRSLVSRLPQRKDIDVVEVEATGIADSLGNVRVANMVALGAFIKKTDILRFSSLRQAIRETFTAAKSAMAQLNIKALDAGAEVVSD